MNGAVSVPSWTARVATLLLLAITKVFVTGAIPTPTAGKRTEVATLSVPEGGSGTGVGVGDGVPLAVAVGVAVDVEVIVTVGVAVGVPVAVAV